MQKEVKVNDFVKHSINAAIALDRITRRLVEEGIDFTPYFDSYIVQEKDLDKVTKIVKEEFSNVSTNP